MKIVLASLLALTLSLCLTACGGGGGGGGDSVPAFSDSSGSTATGENTHPIIVNGGPMGVPNLAFTSVTVCVPGTAQCQTIDNVIVDTGSVGLRLVSSAMGSLSLPAQTAANGDALLTCAVFVDDSYAWGTARRADVKLSNFTASNIPIQIIGDAGSNTRPASCGDGSSDGDLADVANMGGNGIIGIGYFREDCGVNCSIIAGYGGRYYSCNNSGCSQTLAATNIQLQNPIALFPTDNNGVIIDLPAVPKGGVSSVSGKLIFGIDTRSNNALGGAAVFTTMSGYITTRYKSIIYNQSFIDSGSNGLFFPDNSIQSCPHDVNDESYFYCPNTTLNLSATIVGSNEKTISFSVANANQLSSNFNAFNNLAGYLSGTFDWGLPFFYGRKVYTGFETDPQGPFTAF